MALPGSALRDQSSNSDELSVKENRLPCFLEWLTPSKWPQITQTGRSAEKASSPAVEPAKLRFRHSHKLKQSRSLENRSSWWPASFPLEMAFFAVRGGRTNLVLKSLVDRHSCSDESGSAASARLTAAQIVSLAGVQSWLRCDCYPGSAWTTLRTSGPGRATTFFSRSVATDGSFRFHRRLADKRCRRRNDRNPAGRPSIV